MVKQIGRKPEKPQDRDQRQHRGGKSRTKGTKGENWIRLSGRPFRHLVLMGISERKARGDPQRSNIQHEHMGLNLRP